MKSDIKKSTAPDIRSEIGNKFPLFNLSKEKAFATIKEINIVYKTTKGNISPKSNPSLNIPKHILGIAIIKANSMSFHEILVNRQNPIEYAMCAIEKLATPKIKIKLLSLNDRKTSPAREKINPTSIQIKNFLFLGQYI